MTVPDLGAGGGVQFVQWLVETGGHVERGDRVAEVLTDGVLFHVSAPAAGTLLHGRRTAPFAVRCGDVLGWIEPEPEQ